MVSPIILVGGGVVALVALLRRNKEQPASDGGSSTTPHPSSGAGRYPVGTVVVFYGFPSGDEPTVTSEYTVLAAPTTEGRRIRVFHPQSGQTFAFDITVATIDQNIAAYQAEGLQVEVTLTAGGGVSGSMRARTTQAGPVGAARFAAFHRDVGTERRIDNSGLGT